MKRRDWLTWAFISCTASVATLHAQDSKLLPMPSSTGSSSDVVKQVEPNSKSGTTKNGTSAAASGDSSTRQETVLPDNYQPSFSDRMSGFGDVIFRPVNFSWFNDWAGVDGSVPANDVEDPYWVKADMLFAWFKRANTPPMVTTSLPQSSLGIIGNEGTSVLFGDSIDLKRHLGFKFTAGFWTEPSQAVGFEASFFWLPAWSVGNSFSSKGAPLLAATYYDAIANQNSSLLIANETINALNIDQQSGSVNISLNSNMVGAELSTVQNLVRGSRGRLDWSWGYRYLRYDESLTNTIFTAGLPPDGQNFGTQTRRYDEFNTENEFQGLNMSLRSQWWWGAWSLDVNGKLALGAMRSTVHVYGQKLTASPPDFTIITTNGGMYALSSNIGDDTLIRFSVVPELEIGVGYQCCDNLRMTIHYDILAMTSVFRAGDQIDNRINPNILDGNGGNPSVPVRLNQSSSFWMQSFSFGLEYRY